MAENGDFQDRPTCICSIDFKIQSNTMEGKIIPKIFGNNCIAI